MSIQVFIQEFNKLTQHIDKTVDIVIAGKGRSFDQINLAVERLKKETNLKIWWGENYISELFIKLGFIQAPPTFIGRCQKNMLAKLVRHKVFIQTVQSRSQLCELSKLSRKFGCVECMLQINLDKDFRKAGFLKEEIDEILNSKHQSVNIKGLLYMGREDAPIDQRRQAFRYLRESYPELILSMGMSEDWKVAIEEGSDMIRLGKVLFGD